MTTESDIARTDRLIGENDDSGNVDSRNVDDGDDNSGNGDGENVEKRRPSGAGAVDFVGLDRLNIDASLRESLTAIAQRSVEKIMETIQQDAHLKVHIKRYFATHENKAHKYAVVLHLAYSGKYLSIDANDWDVEAAVKKATNGLENRINQVFRTKGAEARNAASAYEEQRNPVMMDG